MKITFVIGKYGISVTEENWDLPHIPAKGDKIDLFNFMLSDRDNVICPIDALEQINRDNDTRYTDYIEYFVITRFRVKNHVWIKDPEGIFCEIHLEV